MKRMIPAKLWRAKGEIKALATFVRIRDPPILQNSSRRIYIEQSYKYNATGKSISKATEKVLLIVIPMGKKDLEDKGMKA